MLITLKAHGGCGAPATSLHTAPMLREVLRTLFSQLDSPAVEQDPCGSDVALGHMPPTSFWAVHLLSWGRDASGGGGGEAGRLISAWTPTVGRFQPGLGVAEKWRPGVTFPPKPQHRGREMGRQQGSLHTEGMGLELGRRGVPNSANRLEALWEHQLQGWLGERSRPREMLG